MAGKEDWLANDLPFEGELREARTVGRLADRDAPTCLLHETPAAVQERMRSGKRNFCVVINDAGIVLGLLRSFRQESSGTVEQIMESGPTTLRPHNTAEDAKKRKVDPVLVTLPDGRLIGAVSSEALR